MLYIRTVAGNDKPMLRAINYIYMGQPSTGWNKEYPTPGNDISVADIPDKTKLFTSARTFVKCAIFEHSG